MSHFSETLSTAIAATGLTLAEVGERTGIDQSLLSRWTAARSAMPPSARNLARLGKMFSFTLPAGQELLFAHLRDVASEVGLNPESLVLSIHSGESDLREMLPLQMQADLDLLAQESLANPDFATLLHDWAAVIRGHQAALARSVYPFPQTDLMPPDELVADEPAGASPLNSTVSGESARRSHAKRDKKSS